MEAYPPLDDDGTARALVAGLVHRHRNRIQNMQSLVGLFARDQPAGPCRDAFTDLRARFDALSNDPEVVPSDGAPVEADLGAFAARIVELLDPQRRHAVAIDAPPVRVATAGRAATMRQLLTEMTILMFRQGLASTASGAGDVVIASDANGATTIRVSARDRSPEECATARPRTLEWAIAQGLADHLGARLAKTSENPLAIEARIPGTGDGR